MENHPEQIEQKVRKLYYKLKNLFEEERSIKETLKSHESFMRENIASEMGLVKNDGTPDIAKVKATLLKKAVMYIDEGINSIEEELNTMLHIANILKNKENELRSYIQLLEEIKEIRSDISKIKKSLKEMVPNSFALSILVERAKGSSVTVLDEEEVKSIRDFINKIERG